MTIDLAADAEALRVREAYTEIRTFEQRMTNRGFRKLTTERDLAMTKLLYRLKRPINECRVLDLGCGTGYVSNWFHKHGVPAGQIISVDILNASILTARETYPDLHFIACNAERLPFRDHSFDVIVAFTLFSSILDHPIAKRVADEAMRVLSLDGEIFWRDMRYPNPLNKHIRPMTRPLIHDLFPTLKAQLETITLLPPLAERLGKWTNLLYPPLAAIPVLRSHFMGLLRT